MKFLDEIYDPQKIETSKKYLRDFWAGNQRIAYSCYSMNPWYVGTQIVKTDEEIVELVTANLLKGAGMPGFNIPRYIANFKPISLPAYWGGQIIQSSHESGGINVAIKPIIHTAEDITRIAPTNAAGGDVTRAVGIWRKLSQELQTDNLACSHIDLQGPLNTVSMLWDQSDFMVAMYENPRRVHALLEQVTEHIIAVVKTMNIQIGPSNIAGPLWPRIWLPPDIGVGIVEDYMPLLSPELYLEFGIPYIEKISNELNGLYIHCCGVYSQHYENLARSKANLLGLEFQYPFAEPRELFNTFGSSIAFVPRLSYKGKTDFPSELDFIKYLNRPQFKKMRLWFVLEDISDDHKDTASYIESMMQ